MGPASQRAAHGDIIDIREEQKGGEPRSGGGARGERGKNYLRGQAGVGGETREEKGRGTTAIVRESPTCRNLGKGHLSDDGTILRFSLSLSLSLSLTRTCFVSSRFPFSLSIYLSFPSLSLSLSAYLSPVR